MKQYWYPTAFSEWGAEEHQAIQRVLLSGRLTMGPEVAAFEEEFAQYHGMKYAVMTNSGSSANLIMIATLFALEKNPLRPGDTVIVPALAWSTTYAPLVQYGLRLQLADCDYEGTWCAEKSYVDDVRLVVGCSILGNPAPLDFLANATEAASTYFVEDNCESLGAWLGNRRCGTYGLMNSFSFFYSHQLSAVEGGMVLTNDVECWKLLRILRAHGWTRDVSPPHDFDEEYNFVQFGYNVRPVEMHAAVAREQLRKLKVFTAQRQANQRTFARLTQDLPVRVPAVRGEPSPFGLAFLVASREVRAKLVKALRERDIDCRLPTGGSFTRHRYGKRWASQPTPQADAVHDTGLFLGCAPFDISDKIEVAVEVMREVL